MGKSPKKGFLLPPAVGYSITVLTYLFGNYRISLKYLGRVILTVLINLINLPFRIYEKLFINKKYKSQTLEHPPIFIIGHWRSGTTHLHNILCQDDQMGYVNTFQSVFPDTLFNRMGRFLFEGFAKILIPGVRKGDNVTLGTHLPQEEEFALGDKTPLCFYYFWMFPRSILNFYDRFIRFKKIDSYIVDSWKKDYKLLVNKALKETRGKIFLSKNPPNTGRVAEILEMFPNARFIHIHRNPIEVFLSTKNFFDKMLPHLQLQTISGSVLETHIFTLYKLLMSDYLEQRKLIPENNLIELSFDNLESDPISCIESVYKGLKLEGYNQAEPYIEKYLSSMKSYKKNKHYIREDLIVKIKTEWGFAMNEWAYDIPEHIEIVRNE
ncbi:sulfotransferase family protein [Lutimonas zeaxanthinifaciens]|uniref:sulfotransferase family protein n=1 Tax=Lutimonas zeaxanthinifaciens TaxID=3060215 RepID=UPI00265CFB95|nr:sulfotransferase [Lutimonas sp. YSD2104]WKK65644.1 sulfotransferase [Lutimonas sp. YSD2104]